MATTEALLLERTPRCPRCGSLLSRGTFCFDCRWRRAELHSHGSTTAPPASALHPSAEPPAPAPRSPGPPEAPATDGSSHRDTVEHVAVYGYEHAQVRPQSPVEVRRRSRPLRTIVVLATLLVVSVAIGSVLGVAARMDQPAQDGPVIARATVGSEGGRLEFGAGMLVIPRGALRSPAEVLVRTHAGSQFEIQGVERVYSFEPTGTHFGAPVTIVLPVGGVAGRPAVIADGRVHVVRGILDARRRSVTIRTRDLGFATATPSAAPEHRR